MKGFFYDYFEEGILYLLNPKALPPQYEVELSKV